MRSTRPQPGARRRLRERPLERLLLLALIPVVLALSAPAALADTGQGVGITEFACDHVTFTFTGFPEAEGNTVHEIITVNREVVAELEFTFNGSTGSNTVSIPQVVGKAIVDAHATWKINGFNGGFDHHKNVKKCTGGYRIEKLQRIQDSELDYTKEPLEAEGGQTAEYEIVVTNTGSVPLQFSNFTDPTCDEGTIAGGPGETFVEPGESTTFTCTRLLGAIGKFTNQATITGKANPGPPDTQKSNEVVITVPPKPAFKLEKLQEIEGSNAGYTKEELKANGGETIKYEIVFTNTGNVPLTVNTISDKKCAGLTGGPGATPVGPGETTTWFCSHVLLPKETKMGPYTNTTTVKATPPPGDGSPIDHTSNTVVVTPTGGTGTTEFTCKQIVVSFYGFPNAENNTVTEEITKNHEPPFIVKEFVFNGPSGTDVIPIELPPGKWLLDVHAVWHTNGASGGFDHHAKVRCT